MGGTAPIANHLRTCGDVFDRFLADCETRMAMDDMDWSTRDGYRKTIEGLWRLEIEKAPFLEVVYSKLAEDAETIIASSHGMFAPPHGRPGMTI